MPVVYLASYFLLEILAFWALSSWLGLGWAIVVIIAAFFGGLALASYEMRSISRSLATNPQTSSAGKAAGDYGLVAFGALLVALPGVVTTVAGLLLILPTRAVIRRLLARSLRRRMEEAGLKSYRITERGATRRYGTFAGDTGKEEVIDESEITSWRESLRPDDFMDPGSSPKQD